MTLRARATLRYLIVAACLGWLAWLVYGLGPARVAAEVAAAHPGWLALSLVAVAGRFLVWAFKWHRMLLQRGPVRLGHTLAALLAGNFVNLTTPTAKLAGGVVRGILVSRYAGWRSSEGYGWSLADQVTNVLGNLLLYGVLALAAAWELPAETAWRHRLAASGAGALGAVAAALLLRRWSWRLLHTPWARQGLARITPPPLRAPGSLGPEAAWVEPVLGPLLDHGSTWRLAPRDLGLAALSFWCLCLANAAVLKALGSEAPLGLLSALVVLGYFAGTLVGTLGGVGVTEVALIQLYGLAGVPPGRAAAAALLHRAGYYAVILLAGGVALWRQWGTLAGARQRRSSLLGG